MNMARIRSSVELASSLCVCIFLAACGQPSFGAEKPALKLLAISDWGEVEKRLLAEIGGDTSPNGYMKSALFQEMLRSDDDLLWNAMVAESEHPIVAVAGFLCIQNQRPKGALAAGFRIIAESKIPASLLYEPIYEKFLKEPPQVGDHSFLDHVLVQGASTGSLACAFKMVPAPVAAAWLRSEHVRQAPAKSVAMALEIALSDDEKQLLTADETEKLLQSFAICPGYPRLIYAIWSRTHDERYLIVLRSVLGDEQFSKGEVYILVLYQKEFITEHLAPLKKGLPEQRARMVEELLKRAKLLRRSPGKH
jgi:hypothetical protein